MKQKITLFKVFMTLVLLCGVGNAWGEEVTLASWTFKSGTAGTNYPSNKTNFSSTGGLCSGSTFYLEGTGSQWNSTKGYAFSAVTYITITLKANYEIKAGETLTFAADMFYNKADNTPVKGYNLTVNENSSSYVTTGLSVTSFSLSTSSANKTVTYTLQNDLPKDGTVAIKYTQTGKAGSGQAYFNNITITGPAEEINKVATPIITPAKGSFVNNATATITCATEGATIYYTTDESTPTNSSNEYTAPITVTETTTFKAIAYKGGEYSSVATATYTKIPQLTITEFIAAEVSDNLYVLEGKIIDIANTEYGNLTIKDNTGEVYVYGLRENSTAANNTFANLNLKLGDVVKIVGKRGEYNNEVQVLDAFHNSHYTPEKENYTVTYNSLGVQLSSETVQEFETAAAIPSPVTPPTGWTFAGWTTEDEYAMGATAPAFFSETTPITEDVNLYAVFSKEDDNNKAWQIVSNVSSLKDGDKIIIASVEVEEKYYAAQAYAGKNNVPATSIEVEDGTITSTDGLCQYTLGVTADGYTFFDGTYYLYAAGGSSNNYLKGEAELDDKNNGLWNISISGNVASISSVGNTSRGIMQFNPNNNSPIFACYSSASQKKIALYRMSATTYYTTNEPKTQPVTISEACYATAYIPFAATVEGATAYYVTVSGNQAQLNEIKGTIPAETGVVLKGAKGTATFTESAGTLADVEGNLLIGTAEEGGEDFEDFEKYTYYILSDGEEGIGFYWDGSEKYNGCEGMGAHCAQYKAVLAVLNSSAGAPSFFTFDDATAINAIGNVKTSSVRYNLNGQAVGEDYKGIVIVNGKKMFNK